MRDVADEKMRSIFERLPQLRLNPAQPSSPQGHEFCSPPELPVRWDWSELCVVVEYELDRHGSQAHLIGLIPLEIDILFE